MESFREKTPEELKDQIKQVSEDLGQEIIQPTANGEVFTMSLEEIKEKFPVRYEMYLKSLRANKSGIEIPEEEKQKMQEWLGVLNNLDKYIENHHINGEKTLRERQITVFEDMRDFLEQGGRDGYIKLPTGAGKTVIFSEFIEATGLKTLIVVPTKILVGQTEEKLEEFAEDLDVGKIYSGAKKHGEDVTIITYQSLLRKLEDGTINPEDYKCLILDEAHTSLSEKRIEAVDKFKHAIRLGFTATPKYSKDKNVGQILNTEIHALNVKEAAEEGVISPFSVILAETNVDISGIKINNRSGEYEEQDLQKVIDTEGRNNSAIELYEKMFNGQLAVVYCSGINHAEKVAELFNKKGIKAEIISGRQSTEEQENLLKKFKKRDVEVLCNADILIAGFDEPKASVCLNLRPTLSPVIAEQRGGRVLRLNSEDPSKHASIVDFIDKNENKKVQQITFAEIAGTSVVYPNSSYSGSGSEVGGGVRSQSPEVEIEGLKIITNSEEVMRVVNRAIEGKAEPAPEGWLNKYQVIQEFDLNSDKLITRFINEVKDEHPEWFKMYIDKRGGIIEHYSPELIAEFGRQHIERIPAPEGWMNRNELVENIKRGRTTVINLTDGYRDSHPEWFKMYLNKQGNLVEHCSPELVGEIKKITAEQIPAPEGWLTSGDLGKIINKSDEYVRKIAEKLREDHSEWFYNYLNKNKIFTEHYSPELIEIIKTETTKRIRPPEGWMIMSDIVSQSGRSERFISKIAESFREEHPDWFKDYLDTKHRLREYHSPELITEITKKLEPLEPAPEGWMYNTALSRELGVGRKKISDIAEKYREEHSEWFKTYAYKSNQFEYYSPELVGKIRESISKQEEAPEGWLTPGQLGNKLDKSPITIKKYGKKYKIEYPDWFKEYLGKDRKMTEHYSPELVEKIKSEFELR